MIPKAGFLNIDKRAGPTSYNIVAGIQNLTGRTVKVGHAGTLDPAATGVLPVALGYATRLIEYLSDTRKGYHAVVRLGTTTTTDDAEGDILEQQTVPRLDEASIEAVLPAYRGTIMQIPPMYSALHYKGQRLYDLARAGQTVDLAPRPVRVEELTLLAYDEQKSECIFDVVCGKGTYVRSLARDIGKTLGCGGHLAALTRTFVGPFVLEQAVSLEDLLNDKKDWTTQLLPPETAIADWPAVTLSSIKRATIRKGQDVRLPYEGDGLYLRAHDEEGVLRAVLERREEMWHPNKVFE